MSEKEKLAKDIAELQKKLKTLEREEEKSFRKYAIKDLNEYTDGEKIEFFDNLYNYALDELNEVEKSKYHDEDCAQYGWETMIVILARDRKDFFDYFNSLI